MSIDLLVSTHLLLHRFGHRFGHIMLNFCKHKVLAILEHCFPNNYLRKFIHSVVNIIYFFKIICAARELEYFVKNHFAGKRCIFTSFDNERVVLLIIVYPR